MSSGRVMDPLLVVLIAVILAAVVLGWIDHRRGRVPDPGGEEDNPYRWTTGP